MKTLTGAIALLVISILPASAAQSLVRIRLPEDTDFERVYLSHEISGSEFGVAPIRTKKGVFDYSLSLPPGSSLKLLIYVPGYRMVAANINQADIGAVGIYEPEFEKLRNIVINGRLLDSRGRPLPETHLSINYELSEAMRFFGYVDGFMPTLRIGSVSTSAEGAFRFEIPDFASDPFFKKYRDTGGRFAISSREPHRYDESLNPNSLKASSHYAQPFIVIRTMPGTLSGSLSEVFLRKHNLPTNLQPYIYSVDSNPMSIRLEAGTSERNRYYNANLAAGGGFYVDLPPGKYSVELKIMGPGFILQRSVPVFRDVIIRENQRTTLRR